MHITIYSLSALRFPDSLSPLRAPGRPFKICTCLIRYSCSSYLTQLALSVLCCHAHLSPLVSCHARYAARRAMIHVRAVGQLHAWASAFPMSCACSVVRTLRPTIQLTPPKSTLGHIATQQARQPPTSVDFAMVCTQKCGAKAGIATNARTRKPSSRHVMELSRHKL